MGWASLFIFFVRIIFILFILKHAMVEVCTAVFIFAGTAIVQSVADAGDRREFFAVLVDGEGGDGFEVIAIVVRDGLGGDLQAPKELCGLLGVDALGEKCIEDPADGELNGSGVLGEGKPEIVRDADSGGGVQPGVEVAEGVAAERRRLAANSVGPDVPASQIHYGTLPPTHFGG